MSKTEPLRKLVRALTSLVAPQRPSQFSCGDCERNEQCGLPPHDDCTEKLLQIARDGEKQPSRPEYLYPAMWPR
jgi:hypothetical protein